MGLSTEEMRRYNREWKREWYSKNREFALQQQKERRKNDGGKRHTYEREYYAKNCERILQQRRENYKENLERHRNYARNSYKRNRDQRMADLRKYYHHNKEERIAYSKDWREKNREKYRAYYTLKNAIRSGSVKKRLCSVCGTKERVDGHHEDYSKPLEVIWLCPTHHKERHRKES